MSRDEVAVDLEACTSACNAQDTLYSEWDDEEKMDAFDELRTCIVSETCERVSEGVCYDDDMYVW